MTIYSIVELVRMKRHLSLRAFAPSPCLFARKLQADSGSLLPLRRPSPNLSSLGKCDPDVLEPPRPQSPAAATAMNPALAAALDLSRSMLEKLQEEGEGAVPEAGPASGPGGEPPPA